MIELKPRGGSQPAGDQDPDGVRVVERDGPSRRLPAVFQTLALLFAAGCVGYVLMPRPTPPPRGPRPDDPLLAQVAAATASDEAAKEPAKAAPDVAPPPGAPSAAKVAPPSTRSLTPRRKASQRPTTDPPEEEEEGENGEGFPKGPDGKEVTAGEYIQALHDAGIYTGIGAFNPPGTSPPLEGLAVPPDFALPEGYVRHGQATDDGQAIEPILMYSPDFEFFDANGNPIPIPDDRVVPPEYAPPGFPIRQIEIPPKREPGDLAR